MSEASCDLQTSAARTNKVKREISSLVGVNSRKALAPQLAGLRQRHRETQSMLSCPTPRQPAAISRGRQSLFYTRLSDSNRLSAFPACFLSLIDRTKSVRIPEREIAGRLITVREIYALLFGCMYTRNDLFSQSGRGQFVSEEGGRTALTKTV
jgi:hypothetical protein